MIHLIACFFLIGAREAFDAEIRCACAARPKLYRSLFSPNYCPRRAHIHTHVPNLTSCPGLGPRSDTRDSSSSRQFRHSADDVLCGLW
jgi:hypothetical protein